MQRRRDFRILVVDDHAAERRQVVLWLRRNGFTVLEAGNASRASLHLHRQPHNIDLVIMDVIGAACLDLAAEIERNDQRIPILYISGYVDSLVVQAIGWRAPELLLLKPFPGKLLLERVRRLLGCVPEIPAVKLTPEADLRGGVERRLS